MNSADFLPAARESVSSLVDGLSFEVAQIIQNRNFQGVYDSDFIAKVALTSQSAAFDISQQFKTAFKRDFHVSEFKRRIADARQFVKQSDFTRQTSWKDFLISGNSGPTACLANAIAALRTAPEWRGVLAFDEFRMRTIIQKEFPGGQRTSGAWTDSDDISTTDWMQHQGILVKPEAVANAVQLVAKDNAFHPVRDYLENLEWDKKPRIGSWLTDYLGVSQADPEAELLDEPDIDREKYISYVGACWLIGAVARIFSPGTKMDTSLILEGPQGAKKSTALKILGGDWFTDELCDFGSKDAAMQTCGVWIIEIGELDAMSRSEVSQVKAFLTRTTDRFRPPFGRHIAEFPRQCVFAGTVNHSAYLRDETGARRFWPVQCGSIHTGRLLEDRDQLWAEAVVKYRDGEKWWFSDAGLDNAAREEQGKRYIGDPWDAAIEEWLKLQQTDSFSISEIMTEALKIDKARWTQMDANRVGRFMRSHSWVRYQKRTGTAREWRYRRAGAEPLLFRH